MEVYYIGLLWGIKMIEFSVKEQAFYDTALNYAVLPNDLIKVGDEQYMFLLNVLNSGGVIFDDLTYSPPKPSQFHSWSGSEWIDPRSEQQKIECKRLQYPSLTRYQFLRCLLENGFKASDIEAQIQTIEDEFSRELTLLGFKEATNFVRTDESVIAMQSILNLNDEKVDAMWEYALTL